VAVGKVYTPRRLRPTKGPYADLAVVQRNLDLISGGFAALSSLIAGQYTPIPPTPTPSGATGFSATYTFGPNTYSSQTGTEQNQAPFQLSEDFSKFGPVVRLELTGLTESAGGAGVFRIRVGGTSNGVDGLQAASISQPSSSLTPSAAFGAFGNPGGQQFIKLTIQSAASTQKALIQNMVLTLRG
jgi:hypothetical protein